MNDQPGTGSLENPRGVPTLNTLNLQFDQVSTFVSLTKIFETMCNPLGSDSEKILKRPFSYFFKQ